MKINKVILVKGIIKNWMMILKTYLMIKCNNLLANNKMMITNKSKILLRIKLINN